MFETVLESDKWKKKIRLIYKYTHAAFSCVVDSSFRRSRWNVLFFATPSGSLPGWKCLVSVILPILGAWTSKSSLIVCGLEGVQWLARGTVVSRLVRPLCAVLWLGPRLLHPVHLDLLQGLHGGRGRRGGRGCVCRRRVLGHLLAHLCVAELFQALVKR